MARPGVSVIVPFAGDGDAATRLARSLARIELGPGDEIVVADNSESGAFRGIGTIRAIRAIDERSSYYARNAGAAAARFGEWLVFIDADCVPEPDLIDAYLGEAVADRVGALAGSVVSDPEQGHLLARYASDRGFLDQDDGLHTAADAAATANLAVRREAFDAVGGFTQGIRSGGDVDFCRRLLAAGWGIERRPGAAVAHLHRESLTDLLASIARYAAGARWLNERYPGSAPAWPLAPGLVHCARDIAASLARRRFEAAAFRGIDALGLFAHTIGYRRSNAAGPS